MKAVYYKYGSKVSALLRVIQHQYTYLDQQTGKWIADPSVFDRVTFEASCKEISEADAQAWVAKNTSGLSPEWI